MPCPDDWVPRKGYFALGSENVDAPRAVWPTMKETSLREVELARDLLLPTLGNEVGLWDAHDGELIAKDSKTVSLETA